MLTAKEEDEAGRRQNKKGGLRKAAGSEQLDNVDGGGGFLWRNSWSQTAQWTPWYTSSSDAEPDQIVIITTALLSSDGINAIMSVRDQGQERRSYNGFIVTNYECWGGLTPLL